MKLYREESFGPVVVVIRARDEEDAIRLADDSEHSLSAAVFTKDITRGLTVARRRIKSGICHVNGPTVHDEAQMPFGGVGASGYGRFGGKADVAEFTDEKSCKPGFGAYDKDRVAVIEPMCRPGLRRGDDFERSTQL